MSSERIKYERVWEECSRYGKVWTDKGLGKPYKIPFRIKVPKGSTVIDFGCGNGSSLGWLKSEGMFPKGVELAYNAVKFHRELISICDLRNPQALLPLGVAQFGLCTDLMEHIPTEDIDLVVQNISEHVSDSVLFGIARLGDKDGEELGLQLHLTIKDKEWWDEKLLRCFGAVEVVRYDTGCYIVWGKK